MASPNQTTNVLVSTPTRVTMSPDYYNIEFDLIIPEELQNKTPRDWKRADVLKWLKANQDKYDLDDSTISSFSKEMLPGRIFLTLTSEELTCTPGSYELSKVQAAIIMQMIQHLHNVVKEHAEVAREQAEIVNLKIQFTTFRYGNASRTVNFQWRDQISMEFLRKKARDLFPFPEGIDDSDITLELHVQEQKDSRNTVILDMDDVLRGVDLIGPITIVVVTKRRLLSSWTFNEIKTQFHVEAETYGDLAKFNLDPVDVNKTEIQAQIDDCLNEVIKICEISSGTAIGTEGIRSLFVYEVLKQVTSLYHGKFKLYVHKEVAGNLGRGPVDYAIERGGIQIVITEAKRGDFDQGVAQCAIQLDSAGKVMMKKKPQREGRLHKVEQLYGIVTTGDMWAFIRLDISEGSPSTILVHREGQMHVTISSHATDAVKTKWREDISTLFGYILAIYQAVEDKTKDLLLHDFFTRLMLNRATT